MSSTGAAALSIAILAGGQSRRMGTDKALLRFNGQEFLDRTVEIATSLSPFVFVVGDRPAYHGRGVPVIADAYPGAAAMGGIATALEFAETEHVLVLACDMPFLNRIVLGDMADYPREYDVLIPVTGHGSQVAVGTTHHTLHAIYTRSCLDAFRHSITDGRLKIQHVLPQLRVTVVDEEWLRARDGCLTSLANMNRPEDLIAFERYSDCGC